MENEKLLSQGQILKEWWQEVKENFWEQDAKREVMRLVKELMESTMQEELEVYDYQEYRDKLERYKHYRNGYYQRSLVTQFGILDGIRVPRLRGKSIKTKVFRRYHRYQDIVEDLIQDIFLAGVSTRKVGQVVSKLLDTKVSHGTVSNITKRLDAKVKIFHSREIVDEYQYLFMDGITLKVKYNTRYHNRKVLAVYGITMFGRKELIDFRQIRHESYEGCMSLLDDLYKRGLKGRNLKLVVTDGAKGLHAALDMAYPLVPRQLCWVHKLRNVTNYLSRKYQETCGKQASDIHKAKNKAEALNRFKNWRHQWIRACPKAVRCLERDIDHLLRFFDCPRSHWKKVRTTNAIERSFKEVRRRTNVFSCFSNVASCDRIIYAIFTHLNNNWKGRPLKDFTQFC